MTDTPATSLRLPLLVGALTALAFFAGFGGWAATAPLAGAAVAPAVIVPDGSRKTVQHLEGGIVRRILVRDGDLVAAGQPLIELDPTRAETEHAALLGDWRALTAAEARLLAEQAGADAVRFPEPLTRMAADPAVARLLAGETSRLAGRNRAQADQAAVYRDRIRQSEAEIGGHQAEIKSADRQLALVKEEAAGVLDLYNKGLERKPRLLALQRQQAEIEGTRATAQAAIARAKQTIAESQQQVALLASQRAEEVGKDLADTRRELAETGERLAAAADKLTRTVIAAPVAGTVLELKVKTPGGVVSPGEAVLDLVPAQDRLILDAKVAPTDIDEVHGGLKALVHLLAYRSRSMPRIEGLVLDVSADRLTDPKTEQPYYTARIAVDAASLPANVHLAPGMPAEALIVTGERTFLSYLLQPVWDTFRRGAKES